MQWFHSQEIGPPLLQMLLLRVGFQRLLDGALERCRRMLVALVIASAHGLPVLTVLQTRRMSAFLTWSAQ